ncbi:hypothetical protein [Helicobacter sp. 11S03491-1]|uniref:hypothetical protein n=1 Tax=Helicobacter sp. 11S03491-1 TaxID=1476196 RepID=UPI0015D9B700|nr:hypothetical protein [Helicobacter sp. 11S03491-1]
MRLDREKVYRILESKLKQANYRWYNEGFLSPEITNEYLAFQIFDTQADYTRLHRGRSLEKLLESIFADNRLDGLNDMVFVGGLIYYKNEEIAQEIKKRIDTFSKFHQ